MSQDPNTPASAGDASQTGDTPDGMPHAQPQAILDPAGMPHVQPQHVAQAVGMPHTQPQDIAMPGTDGGAASEAGAPASPTKA